MNIILGLCHSYSGKVVTFQEFYLLPTRVQEYKSLYLLPTRVQEYKSLYLLPTRVQEYKSLYLLPTLNCCLVYVFSRYIEMYPWWPTWIT